MSPSRADPTDRRDADTPHEDVDARVAERTAELAAAIDDLQAEVRDRMAAEESLRRHAAALREQAQLLDLAHDAIIVRDMDGRVVFWNRGAEHTYGWSRGEAVGNSAHMLLRTEFDTPMAEIDARLRREGRWEGRVVRRSRRGQRIVADTRWALRRDENGEPLAVLEIDTDVTERDRIEQQLRRSEALLGEAQRIARLGNWELDVPTGALYWSEQVYRIFGLSPLEFRPTYEGFLSRVHPEDRPAVEGAVRAAMEEGRPYGIDHRIVRDDGVVRYVHEQAEVGYDADGRSLRMSGTVQDITRRKRWEQAGAEARRYAESIVETIREPLLVLDEQLRVASANSAFYEHFGLAPEGARRQRLDELGGGQWDIPELRRLLRRVLTHGQPVEDFEITCRFERIGRRVLLLNARRIRSRRRTRLVLLAIADITERKRAREALERERKRLDAVLHMLPGWVCLVGRDFRYRFANDSFLEVFGEPGDRPCYEVQFARSGPCENCRLPRVIDRRQAEHWVHADHTGGDGRAFEVWAYPFTDIDGTPVALELGIDVTRRKRLERLVMEASETERRSIGRDLHDTLGQDLTALGFLVRGFAERVGEQMPDEAPGAEQISKLINRAVARVRALARGLDPVGLHEDGIAAGLMELAHTTQEVFNVPCRFECDDGLAFGDEAILTHLYHIAREAVSNAAKHARATRIDVSLRREDDRIVLTVRDDGVGLPDDVDDDEGEGVGLHIVRYRASVINATLYLGPAQPRGTCLRVSVPERRCAQEKSRE
ncbi:MAG: PAS domain-containing sensor histidine kinase [Planctomycetota bacterium]